MVLFECFYVIIMVPLLCGKEKRLCFLNFTTERFIMAVYSRLFLSAYFISQALRMKGSYILQCMQNF